MNKREFFGVAGVGVGSFFLPRISEGVEDSNRATLEGYTNKGIAELIAKFPQSPCSILVSLGSSLYVIDHGKQEVKGFCAINYLRDTDITWDISYQRLIIFQEIIFHKRGVTEIREFNLREFDKISFRFKKSETVYRRIHGVWLEINYE